MSNVLPSPDPSGPSAPVPRGAVLCGIVALSGFIMYQGPSLWDEVGALRLERSRSLSTEVIGYVGISPKPTSAQPPDDWFRVEGGELLLWGGWHPELGHRWFRGEAGDLDRSAISPSMGRDLFRGIDVPMVEVGGGPISNRIHDDHPVDGLVFNGRACAYPVLVLDKVLVVNDEVDGAPLLVVYSQRGGGSSAFEAVIGGDRLRLGFSGYAYQGRPLLYDRGFEGLWLEEGDGIVSLSGRHRGQLLRRIGRMDRLSWADWTQQHQESRVLVGADRSIDPATL